MRRPVVAFLRTHTAPVRDELIAHVSQRGGAIAAANHNGLYEMVTANEGSKVRSCAFSPDKRMIACGTEAGSVTLRGERLRFTHFSIGQSRCADFGAGEGAAKRPQRCRDVRGLLARRHEDRVGLARQQRESLGWVALACAELQCARDGG
eukprot:4304229-Prymnesium_polylepis.2